MFAFRKSKPVVGLDIGSSAVKAVELKPSGKGYKVAAFAVEPVPPDSIVDGAIIDGTAVADAIKRLFENKAFKMKEVAASLSGNAVIVKKINLPVMTDAELSESIYWEAEQYIPLAGVLGPDQRLQQLVEIALDAFAQDEAMLAREFAGVVTTPQDQVVGLGDDHHFLMVAATRHRGSVR